MTIAHKSVSIVETELFIGNWSKKHNKDDTLIETFEGKLKIKNVSEQNYLGFFISDDGSNFKNILAKEKKLKVSKEKFCI